MPLKVSFFYSILLIIILKLLKHNIVIKLKFTFTLYLDYLNIDDVSWFVNKYTDLLNFDCKSAEFICNNVSINWLL